MRCEHLRILNKELTICQIYGNRKKGLPVRMLNPFGQLVAWSQCTLPEYPEGLPAEFPLPERCGYRWSMADP